MAGRRWMQIVFFWHLFAEDAHSQSNSPEAPINDRVDQNTVNAHSRLIAEAEARNMIRFVAEGRALEFLWILQRSG